MKTFLIIVFSTIILSIQLRSQSIVASEVDNPVCFAFYEDYLYIAELYGDKISRLNLNDFSTVPEDVVVNIEEPASLLLIGDELYFGQEDRISKVNLQDTDLIVTDIMTGLIRPRDFILRGDELLFSELYEISKINITDPFPEKHAVLAQGDSIANIGDLILMGDELFITAFNTGQILKLDLTDNDTIIQEVLTGLDGVNHLSFYEDKLYFTESFKGTLSKVELQNPSNIIEVLSDLNYPTCFDFKDGELYITLAGDDLIVKYDDFVVSVINVSGVEGVEVYPNPTDDYIILEGLNSNSNLVIFNSSGQLIRKIENYNGEMIDISDMEEGMYFIQIDNLFIATILKIKS